MKKIIFLLISLLFCHEAKIKALSQEQEEILTTLYVVGHNQQEGFDERKQRVQSFIKEHYDDENIKDLKDLVNVEIASLQKKLQRCSLLTLATGFFTGFFLSTARQFDLVSRDLVPTAFHLGGGRYEEDLKEVSDVLAGKKTLVDTTDNAKETIGKLLTATTKEGLPNTLLLPGYSREEGKPYHSAWFDLIAPYGHYRWIALASVGISALALFAGATKYIENCEPAKRKLESLKFVLSLVEEMSEQNTEV